MSLAKNNANQRKFHIQTQKKKKRKGDNFNIINLDLEPHLVSPLSSDRGGQRVTPLIGLKSPFFGSYWNRGGIG